MSDPTDWIRRLDTALQKKCFRYRKRLCTLDEALELLATDQLRLKLNLDGQQYRKEELVLLVVAPRRVLERLERQVLDDVVDALGRDRRLDGARHRDVEYAEELLQRRLVHDVDDAHLDDQEVEHAAPRRDCQYKK